MGRSRANANVRLGAAFAKSNLTDREEEHRESPHFSSSVGIGRRRLPRVRAIVTAITSRLTRGAEQGPNFFTTPSGNALLFGITFVVVWFSLSLFALLGWLTFRRTP